MATEKRLIERIADRLKDAYPQADRNNLCPAIYYDDFAEIVDDVLSEFEEAVDAVEVVHGQWIVKHNPITDPKGYFIRIVCSQCDLHTGQKSNYCPQCGAKMDGERKDK